MGGLYIRVHGQFKFNITLRQVDVYAAAFQNERLLFIFDSDLFALSSLLIV